jgi:hypothetical protein
MASKRDIVTVGRVISAPAAAILEVLTDPGRAGRPPALRTPR